MQGLHAHVDGVVVTVEVDVDVLVRDDVVIVIVEVVVRVVDDVLVVVILVLVSVDVEVDVDVEELVEVDVDDVLVTVEVLVFVNVDVDVVLCVNVVTTVSHVAPSNCAGQLQLNAFGKACASGHNDATQNAASENSRRPMAVTVLWHISKHDKSQKSNPRSSVSNKQS